jgi:hypothetical protein
VGFVCSIYCLLHSVLFVGFVLLNLLFSVQCFICGVRVPIYCFLYSVLFVEFVCSIYCLLYSVLFVAINNRLSTRTPQIKHYTVNNRLSTRTPQIKHYTENNRLGNTGVRVAQSIVFCIVFYLWVRVPNLLFLYSVLFVGFVLLNLLFTV